MNQADADVRRKRVIYLVQEVLECVSSRRIYSGASAVQELLKKTAALRVVHQLQCNLSGVGNVVKVYRHGVL